MTQYVRVTFFNINERCLLYTPLMDDCCFDIQKLLSTFQHKQRHEQTPIDNKQLHIYNNAY